MSNLIIETENITSSLETTKTLLTMLVDKFLRDDSDTIWNNEIRAILIKSGYENAFNFCQNHRYITHIIYAVEERLDYSITQLNCITERKVNNK